MEPGAQRTAVGATRFVVAEILLRSPTWKLLGQQCKQRYHIGLLRDLGALRPLPPNHHVDWHGPVSIGGEVKRFEGVEPGKLRASVAQAGGTGSFASVSARATATTLSSSASCPVTEVQRQVHRREKGRSGDSNSPPSRSVAAPVIATPLPVPSVR